MAQCSSVPPDPPSPWGRARSLRRRSFRSVDSTSNPVRRLGPDAPLGPFTHSTYGETPSPLSRQSRDGRGKGRGGPSGTSSVDGRLGLVAGTLHSHPTRWRRPESGHDRSPPLYPLRLRRGLGRPERGWGSRGVRGSSYSGCSQRRLSWTRPRSSHSRC